jgi:hypothetical protein
MVYAPSWNALAIIVMVVPCHNIPFQILKLPDCTLVVRLKRSDYRYVLLASQTLPCADMVGVLILPCIYSGQGFQLLAATVWRWLRGTVVPPSTGWYGTVGGKMSRSMVEYSNVLCLYNQNFYIF